MELEQENNRRIEALRLSKPQLFEHPERKDDEFFLGNVDDKHKTEYETFRMGEKAYFANTEYKAQINDGISHPGFVKISEYLEHNPEQM